MRKLLLSAAISAAIMVTASAAQAFPASAPVEHPANDIVQVRGLCGLGWHRGYYGECRPNGTDYGPYAWYGPRGYGPPPARCWWVGTAYGARRVCAW